MREGGTVDSVRYSREIFLSVVVAAVSIPIPSHSIRPCVHSSIHPSILSIPTTAREREGERERESCDWKTYDLENVR